jgi:diguanylate cyclase (GGDEF)-like protein/PAS domain S-box-containing protein
MTPARSLPHQRRSTLIACSDIINPSSMLEDEHQLRLLGSAVEVSGQGIAILMPASNDVVPRISYVNDGFCSIYGRPREEFIGRTPAAFAIVERHQAIFDALIDHIYDQEPFDAEATARRMDGSEFELELQLIPVEDHGELTHWVAFLRDITDSKKQLLMLRHQAMHDAQTDLPNRMQLFERLEKAIDAARSDKSSVALLLMDLDRFKDINDTFGHQFGDIVLKQVAQRLQQQVKPADTVARLGGDEFAVVLATPSDASSVATFARRILTVMEQPFMIDGHVLEVGGSIGIALYPTHGTDARTLLRRADAAMASAKETNIGYAFHNQEHESRTPEQLALVVEMRRAMERNEFQLWYQPKVHLGTGLMTRAEVLIRWQHPKRGLLTPVSFIPIAERTGLIKSMTDWILDHTLQQLREWHDAGAPVHVAVNVSAKSLHEQTLPAKVQKALDKWQIDPRFLKIEITESSIMADPAHALAITSMLQSMGVRLSLDDFGTGYSSLTNLRELPIDELKIDKSFVSGMTASEADMAIVRTMVDLAHGLGKQVCAEGVEDEETWHKLGAMGCDLAQGYWMCKPLPAPAFLQWLVDTFWGMSIVKGLAKDSSKDSSPSTAR